MSGKKVKRGLSLVGISPVMAPLVITSVEENMMLPMGLGNAFLSGKAYIVLALGISADGSIFVLTKNDLGEFIWIPSELCTTVMYQPQANPLSRLVVPS